MIDFNVSRETISKRVFYNVSRETLNILIQKEINIEIKRMKINFLYINKEN